MTGEEPGVADGMKCDVEGNVYCTGPGGVHVWTPNGEFLGRIRIPGHCTNFGWGDADWRGMYFTTYDSVFKLRLGIAGVAAIAVAAVLVFGGSDDPASVAPTTTVGASTTMTAPVTEPAATLPVLTTPEVVDTTIASDRKSTRLNSSHT